MLHLLGHGLLCGIVKNKAIRWNPIALYHKPVKLQEKAGG